MLKNKSSLAAIAFGAALALVPSVASARDRDDYRRDYRHSEHERHEARERWEHRRGYNRGGISFGFSFGAPATRYYAPPPAVDGYYDQFGNWHAYAPAGYYDQYGYWHQR